MRALVIDDDPRGLTDLRQTLADAWPALDAEFADGGEAALDEHWLDGVDLLIASATSLTEGSARALRLAGAERPELARLLVSSVRSDDLAALAPHHLWRPFPAERLRRAGLAAYHLGDEMQESMLEALVGGAAKLPALPNVYVEIQQELRGPDPTLNRIGTIIRQDPAISTRVLRTVNSAVYGLNNEVMDVVQAASLLGLNAITSLVLAVGVFDQAERIDQRFVEQLWRESTEVSAVARQIAQGAGMSRTQVEEAQLSGLLHDIGELVIFMNWKERFLSIRPDARDAGERQAFGATHADIGGFLCALWNLPDRVVQAVGRHHDPAGDEPNAETVVHVARALVDAGLDPDAAEVDVEHLERLGVSLSEWAGLIAA